MLENWKGGIPNGCAAIPDQYHYHPAKFAPARSLAGCSAEDHETDNDKYDQRNKTIIQGGNALRDMGASQEANETTGRRSFDAGELDDASDGDELGHGVVDEGQ